MAASYSFPQKPAYSPAMAKKPSIAPAKIRSFIEVLPLFTRPTSAGTTARGNQKPRRMRKEIVNGTGGAPANHGRTGHRSSAFLLAADPPGVRQWAIWTGDIR